MKSYLFDMHLKPFWIISLNKWYNLDFSSHHFNSDQIKIPKILKIFFVSRNLVKLNSIRFETDSR